MYFFKRKSFRKKLLSGVETRKLGWSHSATASNLEFIRCLFLNENPSKRTCRWRAALSSVACASYAIYILISFLKNVRFSVKTKKVNHKKSPVLCGKFFFSVVVMVRWISTYKRKCKRKFHLLIHSSTLVILRKTTFFPITHWSMQAAVLEFSCYSLCL